MHNNVLYSSKYLTDEERADNYLRYKTNDPSAIPDKYVDQDFHNLSDMELEARYGGIGEIKRRDASDALGLAQQATQQSLHSGLNRPWYNLLILLVHLYQVLVKLLMVQVIY